MLGNKEEHARGLSRNLSRSQGASLTQEWDAGKAGV